MTDIELLELAAKAAGFQNWTVRSDSLFIETGSSRGDNGYYWNPLTDDSDAFRLAVKLGLIVDTHGMHTRITLPFAFDYLVHESHHDADALTATRRAIVRAAAAIGGAA